jgi:membrane protein YdbS with pleckstrin-like domain
MKWKLMNNLDLLPSEFESLKDNDEIIYWVGSPKLIPFLAQGIPFLIIGLLWGVFDFFFLGLAFIDGFSGVGIFIGIFMLFHMFPFYGSILNMIRLVLVHKNTKYAYTSKRLMYRSGFLGIDVKVVDYDKVQNIEVNVSPLENLYKVGTVRVFCGEYSSGKNGTRSISSDFKAIDDPYEIFKAIKQVSLDIKTDMNFPNQLRPEENPGYNTKYTPKE